MLNHVLKTHLVWKAHTICCTHICINTYSLLLHYSRMKRKAQFEALIREDEVRCIHTIGQKQCCVVAFCTVGVNAQRARRQMGFIIIWSAQTFGGPGFLQTLMDADTHWHMWIYTQHACKKIKWIRCDVLKPTGNGIASTQPNLHLHGNRIIHVFRKHVNEIYSLLRSDVLLLF